MVRLMAFCDRTLGNSSLVLCYDSVLCVALLWVLSDCPGSEVANTGGIFGSPY